MIPIKGLTWRITSMNPYKTENVTTDLYMLGIFDENGEIRDYVSSGRPRTYRVYESLNECSNGARALKSRYKGTLRPVRLLTGEVVE